MQGIIVALKTGNSHNLKSKETKPKLKYDYF